MCLVRIELTAEREGHVKRAEEIGRHGHRGYPLLSDPVYEAALTAAAIAGRRFETRCVLLPELVLGNADSAQARLLSNADQPVRLGIGKRAEQHAMDHAEGR